MVAYDNGAGGVTVLLATDPVPDGYTELQPGAYQDPAIIDLQAALGDVGTGLESGCYDSVAAEEKVRGELDRLGLGDWEVTVDGSRTPDGAATCAHALIEPEEHRVELIGLAASEPGTEDLFSVYGAYATTLAEALDASCVGLDEAAEVARTIAAETEVAVDGEPLDFSEESGALVITRVEDPSADCTASNVSVGVVVSVTLRGPAS